MNMSLYNQSIVESSLTPTKPASAVYNAIVAILEEQPAVQPSESGGVSLRSISNYLQSRDNGRYSCKYIDQLVERETAQNNIVKVSDDSFTLPRDDLDELDLKWKQERGTPEKSRKSGTVRGRPARLGKTVMAPTTPKPERVGQRMKRAKKVFDPSDIEAPPTKRRGRPVGSGKKQLTSPQQKSTTPVLPVKKPVVAYETLRSPRVTPPPVEVKPKVEKLCRLCEGSDTNSAGERENLICCGTCNISVHPGCLGFDHGLSSGVQEKLWLCPDCRPCSVCKAVKEEDSVLCSGCDTVFHCCCLVPKLETYPEGQWLCDVCEQQAEQSTVLPTNNTPAVTPANIGLWMFATHQLELKGPPLTYPWPDDADEPESSSIPDASDWNVDDVQKYFKDVGLEVHARVFKDQDVDGTSLLLLKRDDVVRRMGLKLGPALKIYRHVRQLQMGQAEASP